MQNYISSQIAQQNSLVVSDGSLIVIGGQIALTEDGQIQYPGDIKKQTSIIIGRFSEILQQTDATLADLLKLVVFYCPNKGCKESQLRQLLSTLFSDNAAMILTIVPLRELTLPGAVIEIEGYAIRQTAAERMTRGAVTLVQE